MASVSAGAIHTRTLPSQVNQCRIDPAVHDCHLALPLTKTTVGLWDLTDPKLDPLSLLGHKSPVSALRFSHDEPLLLCSAADDHVIVWNIRKCQQQFDRHEQVRGSVILSRPGDVGYVSFSLDAELVAACVDCDVKVVSVSQAGVIAELTGHAAKVTAAEFCPHHSVTLVTISDDRTFRVWDVQNLTLIYQSTIISPTPLISLCMNTDYPQVVIGSAGGIIKIFDMMDGNGFRQLSQLDVGKVIFKSRHGRDPSPQRQQTNNGPVVVKSNNTLSRKQGTDWAQSRDMSSVEVSNSVLTILYVQTEGGPAMSETSPQAHSAMRDVLSRSNPVLAIVSTHCLLQVNAHTLQLLCMVDLHAPVLSTYNPQVREVTLSAVSYAAVGQHGGGHHLLCVVGSLFQTGVHTVLWPLAARSLELSVLEGNLDSRLDDLDLKASPVDFSLAPLAPCHSRVDLTMVPTKPLTDNSPLRSEMIPQSKSAAQGAGSAKTNHRGAISVGKKKTDPMHQPLTFRNKVKSSGYTQAPRTTMFRPKLNARARSTEVLKGQAGVGQSLSTKLASQEYPANAGPPVEMEDKFSTTPIPTCITNMAFSSSGQHLACSLVNMSSLVFQAPYGHKGSSVYVGHDGAVSSVAWSNSGKYLITASSDKTAILWDRTSAEVLLKFTHLAGSVTSDKSGDKVCGVYSKGVMAAQFFYMDRFVLLIMGNHLCLYKCHLDPSKDDIRRYLTKSRYKLVKKWETLSQNFTALSAVNTFHSHLAICAGSNRDIEIFDLNEGRLAHTFTDVHAKPVHTVALNEGSAFTSQPEQAFNVFASSSTLDCIKLWDLRTKRHVLRLEGHVNNAHGCGAAFSPCGTYLSSGSEDKVAYVYDVRTGTYCQKLRGHSDVISSVVFHPARPLLVTGGQDGNLVLFKAK